MKATNIAARMGRWSARHWKTAVIGWIVFVVASIALGSAVGTKKLDGCPERHRQLRPRRQASRQGVQAARERAGARSEPQGHGPDPGFRAAVNDVTTRFSHDAAVKDVRSPYAPGNSGQISKDGHSALVTFDIRGRLRQRRRRRQAPRWPSPRPLRRRTRRSASSRRATPAADKALNRELQRRLHQARDAVAADHARDPDLRVRRTGRGRHPGAARDHRRGGDARAGRASSASSPGRQPCPRSCCWSGMAVGVDYSLFYMRREREERAAGREPAGGARGRRGDLGPLGARLGPDRDRRDGRHVPRRRQDVRLDGHGHDPGRRGRGARVADRAARAAVQARRQGR